MIVRRANLGDISALVFLLSRMHKETTVEIPKINTAKLVDKINQLLHTGVVLVGTDEDNNIVGSIAGQKNVDWWADEEYIGDLWYYVVPNARKSDVAKKLLINFIKIVKETKMKLRLGHVFSGDVDRKDKFYERHGFQKAGIVYVEE